MLATPGLHAGHLSLLRRAAATCPTVALAVLPAAGGATAGAGAGVIDADVARAESVDTRIVLVPGRGRAAWRPRWPEVLDASGECLAFFGEKDLALLVDARRHVETHSRPVAVVACPTVRDSAGLAVSSGNALLDGPGRRAAPGLYRALLAGRRAIEDDAVTDPAVVREIVAAALRREPLLVLEHVAVVDPEDLTRPAVLAGEVRILVAARIGTVRLIDNLAAIAPGAAVPAQTDRDVLRPASEET